MAIRYGSTPLNSTGIVVTKDIPLICTGIVPVREAQFSQLPLGCTEREEGRERRESKVGGEGEERVSVEGEREYTDLYHGCNILTNQIAV